MILVDTAIWIDHLQRGSSRLREILLAEEVLSHDFIIGELACGNIKNRRTVMQLLAELPRAPLAEHGEVMHMLESKHLMGKGLGWVDAHLLTSCLLADALFWTTDRRLASAANSLGIQMHK